MVLVDLDAFKAVNDTHGHHVGDTLISEVAVRLKRAARPCDVVARLGGDEFAILCPLLTANLEPALALARRLLQTVREPFRIEGRDVTVGLSIGVAALGDVHGDAGAAMRNADMALYRAKAEGRNCYRVFEAEMAQEISARRQLAADLGEALAGGAIAILYRPIVEAGSRGPRAMQAEPHWSHAAHGVIAGRSLDELAEEAGLAERLGAFVFEAACHAAGTWPASLKLAVTVSAAQAARMDIAGCVGRALAGAALPGARLEIEIAQPSLLRADSRSEEMLRALRAMGVDLVLDGFGAGSSSLAALPRVPLSKIKIDRTLVSRLDSDAEATSLVAAIAGVARAFSLEVSAEGVATEPQRRALQAAGIAEMRGDLFGPAREARDLSFAADSALAVGAIAPAA
jgi:diguanylate cyclase (GGDEF)-like protein